MFLKNKRRLKADIKLTLIFSSVFWIAAIILCAFIFAHTYSSIKEDERTALQVRMLGYWAIHESAGLDNLIDAIDLNSLISGNSRFFVRVSDELNNTVYFRAPLEWEGFNFNLLEQQQPQPGAFIELRAKTRDFILEAGCIRLDQNHYMQVGISDQNRRRIMDLLYSSFIVALFILIILSAVSGIFAASRFLQPVRALEHTVREILRTGAIDSRIAERKRAGELDELVVSFNRMLERIEALVGGMKGALDTVAHDMRTPVTRFRMIADKALSTGSNDPVQLRGALEEAVIESETILRMMNMLMDISEAESGTLKLRMEECSPLEIVSQAADVYSIIAEERGIEISVGQNSWSGRISADPDRLRQVVGNLLDNAVKYGKDGGRVDVNVLKTENGIRITVRDDGEGISEHDLPGIWERLYRGRSSASGLGLGLSIVRAIVHAHSGSVSVESRPGEGALFTVDFPSR